MREGGTFSLLLLWILGGEFSLALSMASASASAPCVLRESASAREGDVHCIMDTCKETVRSRVRGEAFQASPAQFSRTLASARHKLLLSERIRTSSSTGIPERSQRHALRPGLLRLSDVGTGSFASQGHELWFHCAQRSGSRIPAVSHLQSKMGRAKKVETNMSKVRMNVTSPGGSLVSEVVLSARTTGRGFTVDPQLNIGWIGFTV